MSASKKNLSQHLAVKLRAPSKLRIGIIVSSYHEAITEALFEGAKTTLLEHGISAKNILRRTAPGAFELPLGAHLLNKKENLDALICLGCVLTGETKHADYINHSIATELLRLSTLNSKPFIFGVLTPDTYKQAQERAGGKHGNKGVEAAMAAITMLAEYY